MKFIKNIENRFSAIVRSIIPVCLIIFYFNSEIFSQSNSYNFEHVKIEDGLSQSTILNMLQDKTGYMWFGTFNGLNRFDGYNFKVYANIPGDSTSISDNIITSLYEDNNGILWIGTYEGNLNAFNVKTGEFTRFRLSLDNALIDVEEQDYPPYPIAFLYNYDNTITSIAEDGEGFLWLGTWGNGIIRFAKNAGVVDHYYNDPADFFSLSSNKVTSILIDNWGNVWIGTYGGGLNRLIAPSGLNTHSGLQAGPAKFVHYKHDPLDNSSISSDRIIRLFEDSKNNLWITTLNSGVNKICCVDDKSLSKPDSFEKYFAGGEKSRSLSHNTVMSILEDDDGSLWFGTFGSGLDYYNAADKSFSNFHSDPLDKNSLLDDEIVSLYKDASGIIWVGTNIGEGLTKLIKKKQKFNHYYRQPGKNLSLNDDVVWAIYEDADNVLWVGTYRGGLNKLDRENNTSVYFTHDPLDSTTISDNHVRAVAEDDEGNLWIGTYNSGLNKFNKKTGKFIHYHHVPGDTNSIANDQFVALCA